VFIALLLTVVGTKSLLPSTVNGARPAVCESALRTLSVLCILTRSSCLKYIALGKEVPVYRGVSEGREKLLCEVLVNSGLYR
jgi:hypothetical protein